jgi:hypothetical protein
MLQLQYYHHHQQQQQMGFSLVRYLLIAAFSF